ncbi:hypothetical protein HNP84_000341 [Thermocatellispora tengchongensis]|uniref:Lipoprotein n=1 Tax=Thermocatellispora tengchongensis TaxID=1073253 RepID=A0A840NY81_9ACTN|nr:hypothetical protein [Thermocatellispora tengchongensis]MBB5130653.1 hypothetical protein [Thermocatellispora tengchongensis]
MRQHNGLVAALVLAAGLLAACADTGAQESPSAAPSAPSAAPSDPRDKARAFAQCMRDNGVDLPDPDPDGGFDTGGSIDRQSEAFRTAMEACRAYAPGGDLERADPERLDKARAFAKCMRDNGADVPDPDPDGGFSSLAPEDPDDPAWQKAYAACGDELGRPAS